MHLEFMYKAESYGIAGFSKMECFYLDGIRLYIGKYLNNPSAIE